MVYSFTIDDMDVNCYWEYGKAETYHFWDSPVHFHFMHEIHFILENEVTFVVGNEKHLLQHGDACLISANAMHYPVVTDPSMSRISFFIALKKTNENGKAYEYFSSLFSHPQAFIVRQDVKAKEYLMNFMDCANSDSYLSTQMARAFLELFFLQFCNCISKNEQMQNKYCQNEEELASIKIKIDNFISRKYMNNVTIDELAQTIGYSKSQTSRIIMKITGKTFPEFLTCWRMEVAKMLILNTDQSLAKIAEEVGYQTYAGFYKGFKAVYGVSPQSVKANKHNKLKSIYE